MHITRFKNWRIQHKIMSISVISVTVMMAGLFIYLLPLIESRVINEKKDATRHVVELAMGILEFQDGEVKAGRATQEQAQKDAAARISKLRYNKVEYVWINDLTKPVPKMIMHPTVPALDGKTLDDQKFNERRVGRRCAENRQQEPVCDFQRGCGTGRPGFRQL